MANIARGIVHGGLALRETQDYNEEMARRSHAQRARDFGVKRMESGERRMAAEDTLIERDTVIKQLRQDFEATEIAAEKANQPTKHAQRRSAIEHQGRIQPGAQRLETIQQGVATGAAEAQQNLQPGQVAIAGETQNMAVQDLREKQAANVWGMLSIGDKAGALELFNKSQILQPGRKFKDIQGGSMPVRGADGKPLMKNGKPVTEPVIRMVSDDGGQDEFVPMKKLEDNARKHGTRLEKVGNNMVRIDRAGDVTSAYAPDEFAANPETGQVYSKRTGLPAAGGINQPGGAPAPGARPPRRIEAHEDARVSQGTSVVFRAFGVSDFAGLDPKIQPKVVKIIESMGLKVRTGMNPEAAATAAINEVNQVEAALAAGGKPGGAAAYPGIANWK